MYVRTHWHWCYAENKDETKTETIQRCYLLFHHHHDNLAFHSNLSLCSLLRYCTLCFLNQAKAASHSFYSQMALARFEERSYAGYWLSLERPDAKSNFPHSILIASEQRPEIHAELIPKILSCYPIDTRTRPTLTPRIQLSPTARPSICNQAQYVLSRA